MLIHTYYIFALIILSYTAKPPNSSPWRGIKPVYVHLGNFSKLIYQPKNKSFTPLSIQRRQDGSECSAENRNSCLHQTCDPRFLRKNNLEIKHLVQRPTSESTSFYACGCGSMITAQRYNSKINDTEEYCIEKKCDFCSMNTTKHCKINNGVATCVCYSNYLSYTNCERKMDGCKEGSPAASLTGSQACLTEKNNTCIPFYQSLKYSCLCKNPYYENRLLSFPNCMSQVSLCRHTFCIGFQPPASSVIPGPTITIEHASGPHGSLSRCNETICKCPDGWMGSHCSEPRGQPISNSWSPWTTCNPDCIMPNANWEYKIGDEIHAGISRTTGLGYRSQFSRCTIDDSNYCTGYVRKWERCRITNLCNVWTQPRLSTLVNDAVKKAMQTHDEAHRTISADPITTEAAGLTKEEQHQINFVVVAGSIIFTTVYILLIEIHHLIIFWDKFE